MVTLGMNTKYLFLNIKKNIICLFFFPFVYMTRCGDVMKLQNMALYCSVHVTRITTENKRHLQQQNM